MNLKISEIVVLCGLGLLITPGALAQVPQYQSPLSTAAQPAAALPAPTPITPNGSVVEDIVARVNDRIITRSDYERAARELTQEERQDNDSPQQTAERQKNLLRDLIDQQLLLSRGKDLGINADAEVIRRLDEIRKQNHMSSMEELQKAAESQGVSFEDFKANIRNSIITQEVVRDEVGSKLQLSPSQEQEYYEQHKQEFAQPEQVRLSEILISTPSDPSDAQVAAAKAKADEVSAKIKAGQNFADLAKQYSSDPTGTQGGDLGTYKRGALAKVLEDQTFDLQTGGVTAPIRTRQGFVILKVTDHQKAGVPPLKDIEPQIQEAIYMAQMQPALRAYLTKLREDAYIEIKDGFVDSGASPRETRPVYTSYAPPTVKKKKAVEKTRFDRTGRLSQRKAVAAKPVSAAPSGANLVASNKKHKKVKIKKEKIRFGQAPRNALPAGPLETSTGTDQGAGANSASLGAGQAAAPGTAIAPIEAEANANPDYNPLDQQTTVHKKTRFSDRQKEFEAKKKKQKVLKAKEKTAATPTPETAEEKTTQQVQSAPLGLNGDTAKKKKKKKVKGGKKERMQQQAPAPPKPAPVETPATAPGRATPQEGTPDAGKPAPAAPPSTQN